jgi:hypothetical protein
MVVLLMGFTPFHHRRKQSVNQRDAMKANGKNAELAFVVQVEGVLLNFKG